MQAPPAGRSPTMRTKPEESCAAAYIANINEACVVTDSAGTRYCGRMIPTMEKPLATRTLIAVTTEARRIAFIVVIDSSRTLDCKQAQPAPRRG